MRQRVRVNEFRQFLRVRALTSFDATTKADESRVIGDKCDANFVEYHMLPSMFLSRVGYVERRTYTVHTYMHLRESWNTATMKSDVLNKRTCNGGCVEGPVISRNDDRDFPTRRQIDANVPSSFGGFGRSRPRRNHICVESRASRRVDRERSFVIPFRRDCAVEFKPPVGRAKVS